MLSHHDLCRVSVSRSKSHFPQTLEGRLASHLRQARQRRRLGDHSGADLHINSARNAFRSSRHFHRRQQRQSARLLHHSLTPHAVSSDPATAGHLLSLLGLGHASHRASNTNNTNRPTSLNGAVTARQAVGEWVVELRRTAERRQALADGLPTDITHIYNDALTSLTASINLNSPNDTPFTVNDARRAVSKARSSPSLLGPPVALWKALSSLTTTPDPSPPVNSTAALIPQHHNAFLLAVTSVLNSLMDGQSPPPRLTLLKVCPIFKSGNPEHYAS